MEKKVVLVRLLVILLGLMSLLVYALAVPATRSSMIMEKMEFSVQDQLVTKDLTTGAVENKNGLIDEKGEGEESEERMILEISDYRSPGANHAHDPKCC
ncbi:hypothetical protein HN51_041023 [Arachis hypogaea]|uniref:Uncharacterized protein n=1 Tax=Arachis hypogaea TaxID=3818 RepID=A0A444YQW9_ARAHY|nr:uncharacterized protein DS421_16g548580 [Arachis hypogaea]RYR04278.1 hypothetical protein Ahy_B06g083939 [Arachis hypogaea]